MLIEEAIYSLLSNNASLKDAIGGNIYPVSLPQAEKDNSYLPAVVFGLTGRDREQTHQGPTALVTSRYEFDCLGPEYFAIKQIADKVRLALNGKRQELDAIYGPPHVRAIFLDDEVEEYVFDTAEQLSLYRIAMAFTIKHWENLQ